MTSFIYIIASEPGDHVNVGGAPDAHVRLRELQSGNPLRLRIEMSIPMERGVADWLLRRMRESLRDYRENGDWYATTPRHAHAVLHEVQGLMSSEPPDDTPPVIHVTDGVGDGDNDDHGLGDGYVVSLERWMKS